MDTATSYPSTIPSSLKTTFYQHNIIASSLKRLIAAQNLNSLKWRIINTSESKLLHRNQWNHYYDVLLHKVAWHTCTNMLPFGIESQNEDKQE